MDYTVVIPKPVLKIFSSIPQRDRARIVTKLQVLEIKPNPIGSLKLEGYDNQYRIRVGDYRIRNLINHNQNEIAILDIAHRKEIYKKK
jgi:mRNA interferase RelE/StbE